MTAATLAILLLVVALVLLALELILPTQGMLGFMAIGCLAVMVGTCFRINGWLGLGVLAAIVFASPFVFAWAIDIWQRTPVGRRIVLQPLNTAPKAPPVRIGQTGITRTELRPMGEVEFGDLVLEASCEAAMIARGQTVKVIAIADGRPRVRAVLAAPGNASDTAAGAAALASSATQSELQNNQKGLVQ